MSQAQSAETVRIIGLKASNFKNLAAVELTFPETHGVLQISGRNGAGKSSLLDAIQAVFDSKSIPRNPIKNGEKRAEVTVDMGELIGRRVFTPGGDKLYVTAKDGAQYRSPQSILDKLYGDFAFDPLEFVRLKPKEQVARLLSISPVEIDLAAHAADRAAIFANRTEVNRDVTRLQAQLGAMADVPEKCPERIDVAGVLQERKAREQQERENQEARSVLAGLLSKNEDASAKYEDAMQYIKDLRQQLAEAERLANEYRDLAVKAGKEWERAQEQCEALPAITFDDLDAQLEAAETVNRTVDRFEARRQLEADLKRRQAHAAGMTDELSKLDAEQVQALQNAAAQIPVPGLMFDAECVTINGLPLTDVNMAEQLRVGVAIAMAANPRLRLIRIENASLLDSDSQAVIASMAAEHDYLVLMEMVDESGEVGIVIEDGAVTKIN